jgi:general secretion pathway protein G
MIRRGGFTLIEMLIVVAMLAILASAAFPLVQLNAQRNREQDLHLALRQIRSALDAYKQAYDEKPSPIEQRLGATGYPRKLGDLAKGIEDVRTPDKKKIYFLRRLPRDPMFVGDADVPAAETWGLRSYASPPDEPQEGDDVFDVYSLSTKTGLNGIPYREW